jgi:tRNA-specific 2-thiouridylase
VRKRAFQIGLRVHDKPESQEICFVQDASYQTFLSERLEKPIQSGPIIDRKGSILGRHRGIPFYTIGQRRGLGLVKGKPLYVVGIDLERNAIIVGEEKEVYADTFTVDSVNWIVPTPHPAPPPLRGEGEGGSGLTAQVKIRYNHPGTEALLFPKGEDEVEVKFKTPQKAITPGQAAVFYDGDTVLGGGWIKEVILQ